MNGELLASTEREILGWSGVSKKSHGGGLGGGGIWVPPAKIYKFGRRALGHVHEIGVADFAFSREIRHQLVSEGRAKPHGAGFAGVVSYPIRKPEDVPGAVELFRMSCERAKAAAERRGGSAA